ncbi:MAG: phosphate ABC transporter substrate-binding protein PstS [Candidatus Marinimicrobia bacterium]|nr:phosphate ABC transporter substrate-binding protein PstS [Candidatus Neomarinimicrobiota bacterium]
MLNKICLILLLFFSLLRPSTISNIIIKGSGATLPYPLYEKWIEEFSRISDIKIIYEPLGSGQGIKDVLNERVDFGGTDIFLSDEELNSIEDEIIHIPTCIGAIVFTYNLPVETPINISKKALVQILTGKIKKWNNYLIQTENPNIILPDKEITLIHRSDDSGSTFLLTHFMSKISKDWQRKYGYGKNFQWETGLGVEGNENVAKFVSKIPGSLGYISYTYAREHNLPVAKIENKNGNYVLPTVESIRKSAETNIPDDVRILLIDSDNEFSYPISTFSYIIFKRSNNSEKFQAGTQLFQWILTEGQKFNEEFFFAPIPENVAEKIYDLLK